MLDLEAVHGGFLGDDRLEQEAKRRNIPLAVAQIVKQAVPHLLGIDFERLVEGAAGRQDVKLLVEHQKWLWNRVDDRLRQDLRVVDILG